MTSQNTLSVNHTVIKNRNPQKLQESLADYFVIFEQKIKETLQKIFENKGIRARIEARYKSAESIKQKLLRKNILFSQVLDVVGFRIITETEADCYEIMETILQYCPALNTKIKDYIILPKENGYQSIHLTVLFDQHPIEIQIRTYAMHYNAEYGEAAHDLYKNEKWISARP